MMTEASALNDDKRIGVGCWSKHQPWMMTNALVWDVGQSISPG